MLQVLGQQSIAVHAVVVAVSHTHGTDFVTAELAGKLFHLLPALVGGADGVAVQDVVVFSLVRGGQFAVAVLHL